MNDLITNGTEIKQRIISEITKASENVYVAVAWFTDRDIANAIISAKNRNVVIDIILSSNTNNEEVIRMLKAENISVHAFDIGDTRGLMHHKFCLFDNKFSINGSFNFSYNASKNNVENIVVSDDKYLYAQFLTEFEQLKYNIDNQIALTTSQTPEIKVQQLQPINIVDTFAQQLDNLLYSTTQINAEEYKKKGYETSKRNQGNIDIFRAEYNEIAEEIKAYANDDGLNNKKSILTSNISNVYRVTKSNLEAEKQDKISIAKKDNELEKRQLSDKITRLQEEKSILESGNQNTGEKGLLQINKEIEKNKLEKKTLEQSFDVKPFWNMGTILSTVLLIILTFYLSFFFASAVYKVLFEYNIIQNSMEAGVRPGLPELFDANAIVKIFRQKGIFFGFVGVIFFVFPVALSNIKLFGSKDKLINSLLFWVGLLIFDVVVAAMIAKNTDEIKSLLIGKKSQLNIWEVVKHGEFWMIFMFGMIPLIITHYVIEKIFNSYKNSQRDLVDAEKSRIIQLLDTEVINLNSEKESIGINVNKKDEAISECKMKIIKLETDINSIENQIESRYAEMQKQINAIYEDFNTKIVGGRIFTDVILSSVITSYKSGFIEYLPKFYSTEEVSIRVKDIEQILNH